MIKQGVKPPQKRREIWKFIVFREDHDVQFRNCFDALQRSLREWQRSPTNRKRSD